MILALPANALPATEQTERAAAQSKHTSVQWWQDEAVAEED